MNDDRVSRRHFLQSGTLLGGGLFLSAQLPFPRAARAAADSDALVSLTAAQQTTLEAITARLIPTDHEPGAREAGCANFIDKALAHEEAAAKPAYEAGLRGVESAARATFERPFTELSEAEQDGLLAALEGGSAKGWPAEAGHSALFFGTVRFHTIAGFLSDPKYGGNRDFAGWRVTRYPGPRHLRGGYSAEQVTGKAKVRTVWGEDQ